MRKPAIVLFPVLFFLASCSSSQKCYKKKKEIMTGYWSGKVTDHYFKLRRGNNFQYYERLIGLTKLKEHNGTYFQQGDTLLLTYCGGKTPEGLSNIAVFNKSKTQITLLTDDLGYVQRFQIVAKKKH